MTEVETTFRNLLGLRKADTNYVVNFSARFRYIYVETPKAACSTIKRSLQFAEAGGDAARLPDNVHDRDHSPIQQIRNDPRTFRILLDDPRVIRFCFVRNPFTRALSCYLDKFVQETDAEQRRYFHNELGIANRRQLSFRDYLLAVKDQPDAQRNIHWMSQSFLLQPRSMAYDFIGRFEHLQADLDRLFTRLGLPRDALQTEITHATSAGDKIKAHYGDAELDLVRELYEEDFNSFGYGWSPRVL
ncbi:sulfotransferase family protein [Acidimangrovimonas pyrenivorans]|uniref:Sulfotransferase family protein n=1 Tax=Acidimangrovimonas pyrenivorans TaxID=2030798 RepID=A0ABV7AMH1_9RHOB